MYELVKSVIKFVLPKSILQKNNTKFRSLVALFYKGNTHRCNICEANLSRFITLKNGDLLCPSCGSLPRTRRLYTIIKDEIREKRILHFSPPRSFKTKLKQINAFAYISTDFEDEFEADKKIDICKIDEEDQSYEMIICYHVLEHIVDDVKAMSELYRILSDGGKCFIQTPFKDGEIYENYDIVSQEDRLHHFGQSDHVRIYNLSSLKQRLEQAGFNVSVMNFEEADIKLGLKSGENVLVAKRD